MSIPASLSSKPAPSFAPTGRPMVQEITRRLRRGAPEPYSLTPADVVALRGHVATLFGKPEVVEAVETLALFAAYLHGKGRSPDAARKLLEIAVSCVAALKAQRGGRGDALAARVEIATRRLAARMVQPGLARGGGLPLDR